MTYTRKISKSELLKDGYVVVEPDWHIILDLDMTNEDTGYHEGYVSDNDILISDWFENWENPTETELSLFQLEFGFKINIISYGEDLKPNYEDIIDKIVEYKEQGKGSREIAKLLKTCKSTINNYYVRYKSINNIVDDSINPKVLFIDLETAPILGNVWRLFKENIGLNQIEKDWHLLSYCAKWHKSDESEVFYNDQRNAENIEDDTQLLSELWKLLDEADIVVGQNSIRFDVPKVKARMIIKGFKPFSSFKQIDTMIIAKKTFGFTSNKLEYLTDKLCTKYKKNKHSKFAGFELWKECLAGNQEAYDEMKNYNVLDVLSLEELYEKMAPWFDKHPNFNLYSANTNFKCNCGCSDLVPNGYAYTQVSKFQRYKCKECGAEYRGRKNLFSKEKRESLLTNVIN